MSRWIAPLLVAVSCADEPAVPLDPQIDDVATDQLVVSEPADTVSVDDDLDAVPLVAPTVTRLFYGTTVEQQTLIYYRIRPAQPNGKSAFLTFAVHGFEDAWAQDGRALYSIAHAAIDYY